MSFDSRNNLVAARSMAERGWHVFPCHTIRYGGCSCGRSCRSPAKHPMTPNGHHDASCDLARITAVWEDTPWANIGIRTGPESGIWVLDLDGEDGIQDLAKLEAENGPLPRTPTLATGSGGRHLYFDLTAGLDIKNATKIRGMSIDVRGAGGYVIGAGSHNSDGRYYWEINPDEAPLAVAPDWLLKLVTDRQPKPPVIGPADGYTVGSPGIDVFQVGLDTDPGAGQGKRHNRACQLIGAQLGWGEDPESVLAKALEWGKRCDPPMDEGEIERIVSDFATKDRKRIEDEAALIEQEIQSHEKPWPGFDETALYGLAGEIVRAIEPSTEADRVAILAQFLAYFGNVIGRGPYFEVEATRHQTNLFAVLVGQTAKGRKGTSENRVKQLFGPVDEEWSRDRLLNGLSSGEGLIWAVRDPIEKTEPIKEKGVLKGYQQIVTDPGISDKRLLVRESEFASVLKVIRRDGNTLSPTMRDAWDSGDLRTMTKNSAARATGAHISIVGHITKEELLRCMNEVEGVNGFANRFLFLCVRRSKLLPDGGSPVDLSAYIERLTRGVEFAKSAGRMTRDAEAKRLWFRVYGELAASHPGLFGAVISRAEAQVLRLSMLYTLLDESGVIRAEHLRAAMALWRYAEDSARYIFGGSTGDPLADKVLGIIRTGPVTTKEIHDKTNRRHKAEELSWALGKLKGMGLIKSEQVATGGRPAERWGLANGVNS